MGEERHWTHIHFGGISAVFDQRLQFRTVAMTFDIEVFHSVQVGEEQLTDEVFRRPEGKLILIGRLSEQQLPTKVKKQQCRQYALGNEQYCLKPLIDYEVEASSQALKMIRRLHREQKTRKRMVDERKSEGKWEDDDEERQVFKPWLMLRKQSKQVTQQQPKLQQQLIGSVVESDKSLDINEAEKLYSSRRRKQDVMTRMKMRKRLPNNIELVSNFEEEERKGKENNTKHETDVNVKREQKDKYDIDKGENIRKQSQQFYTIENEKKKSKQFHTIEKETRLGYLSEELEGVNGRGSPINKLRKGELPKNLFSPPRQLNLKTVQQEDYKPHSPFPFQQQQSAAIIRKSKSSKRSSKSQMQNVDFDMDGRQFPLINTLIFHTIIFQNLDRRSSPYPTCLSIQHGDKVVESEAICQKSILFTRQILPLDTSTTQISINVYEYIQGKRVLFGRVNTTITYLKKYVDSRTLKLNVELCNVKVGELLINHEFVGRGESTLENRRRLLSQMDRKYSAKQPVIHPFPNTASPRRRLPSLNT